MWKSFKNIIMIPKSFKIAGGKLIHVKIVDTIKKDDEYEFGEFNSGSNIIYIARRVLVNDISFTQTEEDIERTFWHEYFHCCQFYSGVEFDESMAQTFSNFMYEYLQTKE